ncbi:hypothetical protein DFO47_11222 [Arthrobacter sp. AG258]|uniref:hypothetical protein n=1 Tax=Arthrobacter sp. AG258 TaxID=2183899 RepID=UPI00105D12A1|nr:hypothetical protein [Arthrobacter sp. AG258]TDT74663.1 hypothetical protein DFO47_11222 [Arthrobacter sp. AG258]
MTHHFTAELRAGGKYRALNNGWHLRLIDGPAPLGIAGRLIPTLIPGSIALDLATAGILPGRQAEATPEWIADCLWEYSLDFPFRKVTVSPTELVTSAHGAVVEVHINGHALGKVEHPDNGLWDIGSRLFHGLNNLKISTQPTLDPLLQTT